MISDEDLDLLGTEQLLRAVGRRNECIAVFMLDRDHVLSTFSWNCDPLGFTSSILAGLQEQMEKEGGIRVSKVEDGIQGPVEFIPIEEEDDEDEDE